MSRVIQSAASMDRVLMHWTGGVGFISECSNPVGLRLPKTTIDLYFV